MAAQLICEALDLHRRDAQKPVQENDEKPSVEGDVRYIQVDIFFVIHLKPVNPFFLWWSQGP